MDIDDIFSRLDRFTCPATVRDIKSSGVPSPDAITAGRIGKLCYVLSADSDGRIEASISSDGRRATWSHVEAFCRHAGLPTPDRVKRTSSGILVWVVQSGVQH